MATELDSEEFILLTGSANPQLAAQIAAELGIALGQCAVQRFPDGEVSIELLESVRRKEVFLLQPTSPPVNDHLMELLALADACRRACASRITAIVPYLGYSRADKRGDHRLPITASMVADVMEAVGIQNVITMDLHAAQIEGFFHIPVDSLTAVPFLCEALREHLPDNVVVVSPDAGRVRMATEYARWLSAPLTILHKRRINGTDTEVTQVVGDVKDQACLIIDDMISTGGTLVNSVKALHQAGARPEITVAAVHGLFLNDAYTKLTDSGIGKLFVTNTIPVNSQDKTAVTVVSVAPLLATAIRRSLVGRSLATLR